MDDSVRLGSLVALARVIADKTQELIDEADYLHVAVPANIYPTVNAWDSWASFLERTYRS